MRLAALLLAATVACSSATSRPGSAGPPAPGRRSPYEAPPAAAHDVQITIDQKPALEILAALSRNRFELSDVKIIEDLPAVRLTISDSGRPADVFERDFAAAFDESSHTAVFDFQAVRHARDRWSVLLQAVASRQSDLLRQASHRAAALLPGDRPISVSLGVAFTFGLAGLADHFAARAPDGRELLVVDLSRALGESEGETPDGQVTRVARLIAGEAYRQAWATYREGSPSWKAPDPILGDLDPLLRTVAEVGPTSIFAIDENFLPFSVWLKEPMRRAIEEFNRRAERFAESHENLEQRVALTAEVRRADFRQRVAGPAGAFLTDAIVETLGIDALRTALARGPRAFFQAYDRATQTDHALLPLPKGLRERVNRL